MSKSSFPQALWYAFHGQFGTPPRLFHGQFGTQACNKFPLNIPNSSRSAPVENCVRPFGLTYTKLREGACRPLQPPAKTWRSGPDKLALHTVIFIPPFPFPQGGSGYLNPQTCS